MNSDASILGMFDVSVGTWALLSLIGISALIVVRNHLSSLLVTVAAFPLILACSLIAYHVSRTMMWFNEDKMADWLAFTIINGTVGTMVAIMVVAVAGRLQDRSGYTA
jgi:ABC-type transport system involved in cytochrome c biogenesis permease component